MSCSVSVNANYGLAVSSSDFPNVPTVNILRNGRWIVTHRSETPVQVPTKISLRCLRSLFVCDSFTTEWWCGE